jgi:hypothetical protein
MTFIYAYSYAGICIKDYGGVMASLMPKIIPEAPLPEDGPLPYIYIASSTGMTA